MQRYGPPPSYPHLKIPPGSKFGYHARGSGKPPVDEYGRPLYGDVFGVLQQEQPNYDFIREYTGKVDELIKIKLMLKMGQRLKRMKKSMFLSSRIRMPSCYLLLYLLH
nr:splicing factor 3B subunit 2 [Ipomoea batatas]